VVENTTRLKKKFKSYLKVDEKLTNFHQLYEIKMTTWEQVTHHASGVSKIYRNSDLREFDGKDISKYIVNNNDLKVKLGELQYAELNDSVSECIRKAQLYSTLNIISVDSVEMQKINILVKWKNGEKKEFVYVKKGSFFHDIERCLYHGTFDRDFKYLIYGLNSVQLEIKQMYNVFDIETIYKIRKWTCIYKDFTVEYDVEQEYEPGGRKYKEAEEKINQFSPTAQTDGL
jgi:hypothetical protein